MYEPVELAKRIEGQVCRGKQRKYYRLVRSGRWYGGIATSDCCGCQLRCIFCWSGKPRDHPESVGKFYSPQDVVQALTRCAQKHRYRQIRISGNEPTIGREHLVEVLRLVENTHYTFILETNGLLIDREYAESLKGFSNLHVRVSLKGSNPEEFGRLTLAKPEYFHYQVNALRYLFEAGVSCHPAVMLSMTPKENVGRLREELQNISPVLAAELEEEYIFLYPHVVKRLRQHGLKPLLAYSPDGIPEELI